MTPEEMIYKALEELGVKGTPDIKPAGYHRYHVVIGEKFDGIYDIDRKTFVD